MGYSISDKVILITGSNRGIGRALLETFLAHGAAKIYAAVRAPDTVLPLVERHGDRVVPIPIDLTDPPSIQAAANRTKDVQVVVNNAGVLKTASPLDPGAIDSLHHEMSVNLYGLIRLAQAFGPLLRDNGGGAFVQLNSVVSMKSFADFATYSASKAAAYSITQALREVFGQQGTLVVSVHPGPIATDMAHAAGLAEIAEPPSVVAEAILEALKTGAFHAYAGAMARQIGDAYEGFATQVIEADITEG